MFIEIVAEINREHHCTLYKHAYMGVVTSCAASRPLEPLFAKFVQCTSHEYIFINFPYFLQRTSIAYCM